MPFNGSGGFTRIYNWVTDAANNIDITASRMDTDTNDITANGLGKCITVDGQSTVTANLPMGGFRHTGVSNGVAATDYVAMGQLQTPGLLALFASGLTVSTTGITVQAGGISVTGTSTITGGLTVSAGITSTSTITVQSGGILVASGGVNVQAGGASITGNVAVAGTLTTTQAVTVQAGDLNVSSGNIIAGSNITAGGALVVNGGGTAMNVPNGLALFNIIQTNGSTSSSQTGWDYSNVGPGAFGPAGVNYAIIASGSNMLAANFYAVSDIRLKLDVEAISPEDARRWLKTARPVTYRKKPRWDSTDSEAIEEAGFIAQEQLASGYGRFVSEAPHPGMPETKDGPPDVMLSLPQGYQIAFLTAALKNALDRIEQLEKSR